jgi:flagellar hook-associated protein 1 FlgK
MSLLSTLSIGTRGLFAAQLGMDVAGQNISNADVAGYSRKRLNMSPDYRYDGQFGQMGFGVDVINIERMRDALIDEQIRRQDQQVGYYSMIDETLEKVENVFTEPGETGLQHYLDNFFDSWQNLINNPADLASRTMVKTGAEVLTDEFHNLSNELRLMKEDLNVKIDAKVQRVNELAQEINNMNAEVGAVEIGNQNANDSRDKRDEMLKELATLIDIDTTENGIGQVTVTTAGNMLVSPAGYRTLETTTSTSTLPDGTTARSIRLRFADSKRPYSPLSGEIKGLFDSRDIVVPEYERQLDTLALALMRKVNEVHSGGYSLYGYTGMSFFDTTSTGASDINLAAEILSDVQNIAAASGGAPLQAITVNAAAGQLDFGNVQQLSKTLGALWTAADPLTERARNVVHGSVVLRANGTVLTENTDYHVDYVQGTIQMLHAGYNGLAMTVDFRYDTGRYNGPGDNSNAVRVAQLRHELTMAPDPLGNDTNTFTQYYSAFIGKLGLARNEASANLQTRQDLVAQYQRHQDAIAGVSLDEEMADIIKYQHTYTAAARVITTTSAMLDVLMNM